MSEEFRTGYGRDWLDFAITLVDRYGAVPRDLVETPGRLREALHGLAKATATGQPPTSHDVRVVHDSLADDVPPGLRHTRGSVVASRPVTTRQALARLARQAVDDLTGPNRARLRACGDDECSGIFLDPTGRRRWCSDERCGVRSRVRAHRARAKQSAGQQS